MMAGPDGPSTPGGPAGPASQTTQHPSSTANNAHPPISHPPHPQQHPPSDPGRPAYPSLAYPAAAGPSQPPQHFGQPGGAPGHWGYNPYYFGGGGPHHAGGPPRPQANGGGAGGAYQPGFNPAYQGYPFPPHQQFYPPYGQMQVPGPGPGTMQNAYYVGGGYGGFPPSGDAGANGAAGDDNGQAFHPNMPFQQNPYYPPNHPYAYGGGVGYQQQHQHAMPYGGYRPDGFVHDHHPHPHHQTPHHMSHPHKGLNPAAQGFQYHGRTTPSSSNGNVPNGTERQPPAAPASSTPQIIAPVPEKVEAGSLGLSLGPAEPEPAKPETPATKPSTEAPPAAHTDKPTEAKEDVPKDAAVTAGATAAPSEKADDESATESDGLTFTGSVLAGVDSPRSSAPSKPRSYAKDPILIRPSCPPPDAQGVYFASHLANRIPDSVPREHVDGVRRRRLTTGYAQPKGKAVFTAGVKDGHAATPATGLVFGEISSPPVTPVIASPPPPAAAAAAPKAKPSSWASLLRASKKPGASTPDSLSVAPSSTLVSPSKSIVSLPPSDFGPETPRSSATASLPPSSGPAPSQPRPSFNYAAAAAVGAPLSPAEDLARLLTDGVRARGPRPAQPITPRGLINTGNMCFANTILQVLVYCTPFTELFDELGKRLKADLARRTPLLEAMIYFLQEFVPGPSSNGPSSGTSTPKGKSRDVAFVPEHVYDAMKENKRFDSMRRGFQEDAEEYLGFFLNTLHEEMLNLYSRTKPPSAASKTTQANGHPERTIGRPVSPGANGDADGDDWLEVGKRQKTHVVRTAEAHESAVSRIFGGTLRSVLHAPGQKDSVTLEPYQPLQLDVQSADVVTLVDALKHLNEPETVPGVWVAARKANVDATKQVFLETFPQVLILHLKRFVYDPQEQNVVKRSKPVAYGTELVIPQDIISAPKRTGQPVKYRLFGVVYHHGYSATGGHYTVAVSRPDGTGWLHFDDESVQPVPTEDVVVSEDEAHNGRAGNIGHRERCAYLLFYQRAR